MKNGFSSSAARGKSSPMPFKLIDLFAGCGGFSLGFEQVGSGSSGEKKAFEPVWANDSGEAAAETYRANFAAPCDSREITRVLEGKRSFPSADVVVGGPPCQGFSLLGKNRSEGAGGNGDPRNELWRPFMEVVERSGAQVFVMENVPRLLGSPQHSLITGKAAELGFRTASRVLCAADYGVPQTRTRAFVLGWRGRGELGRRVFPPRPTHSDPRGGGGVQLDAFREGRGSSEGEGARGAPPSRWRTVRDAVGDLPPPVGTQVRREEEGPLDLHFGRNPTEKSEKRYRAIPEEGMNRIDLEERAPEITPDCWKRKNRGGTDLFGRLWWDRPAFTIRTEFFKPEKGRFLHPSQHRAITHREAARFQSFPDSFAFKGSKRQIARQIGNAVPPLLARRVGEAVRDLLLSKKR